MVHVVTRAVGVVSARIVVNVGQLGDVAAEYLRRVADAIAEGMTCEHHGSEHNWTAMASDDGYAPEHQMAEDLSR